MDWVDPNSSDLVEKMEKDMSSLSARFATRMCKRVASAQGKTTPGSEVSGGKSPKRSFQDKEAHRSPTIVTVDSLKRAPDALPTLEGASQDVLKEPCASMENGVQTEGPLNVDGVVGEAPSEIAIRP